VSARKSSSSGERRPETLACPGCALRYSLDESFCKDCGLPLVYVGTQAREYPASDARIRARKIRPEYTEGPLVRVAGGRNQAEAELIQNMLLEEGVPSVLRRAAGFDVPDFLAAGPRDVLVPQAGAEAAGEVLLDAGLGPPAEMPAGPPPLRVLGAVVGGGALTALVAWLLLQLAG
jgi:hypothetical protein